MSTIKYQCRRPFFIGTLAVMANAEHPLADAQPVCLADLEDARRVVYRANMPIRRLLEREFHEAGLRPPLHLVETTSAFTTMSRLQKDPQYVAMLPVAVVDFCTSQGWARKRALHVASRSEPYELVTRRGAPLSPGAEMLISALTTERHAGLPSSAGQGLFTFITGLRAHLAGRSARSAGSMLNAGTNDQCGRPPR
ncbi:LysR substrate-binding domain-containing protein [Paraburkholderia silvatlantica]|uniref:LysR substrate-binding domain-containing protein n=1 Tax=Paraburkholderia silvatlantica TaxID=321895 RepID=UPI0024472CE2|nr:LysR substrate-binding domain-containing protein [Paraburkholderia silvatlantica]